MTTKELMKQAELSIRTLSKEREELEKQASIYKLSHDLVETMIDKEMLSVEEVLPKLAEFESRGEEDLKIIKKALELGTAGNMAKLGEVSDKLELSGMTPEERFIQNTVGDLL